MSDKGSCATRSGRVGLGWLGLLQHHLTDALLTSRCVGLIHQHQGAYRTGQVVGLDRIRLVFDVNVSTAGSDVSDNSANDLVAIRIDTIHPGAFPSGLLQATRTVDGQVGK